MKQTKITKHITILAILCTLLSACTSSRPKTKLDYEKFQQQRAAWKASNLKDYSFEYYHDSDVRFVMKVNVVDGKIHSLDTLKQVDVIGSFDKTMDKLYEEVDGLHYKIQDPEYQRHPIYIHGIGIEYDEQYHTIKSVYYEYYNPGGAIMHGDYGFKVEHFKPTAPTTTIE